VIRFSFINKGDSSSLGKPLAGFALSRVVESKNPSFKVGDVVIGATPWQEYSVVNPSTSEWGWYVVNSPLKDKLPITTYLGLLGSNALTVYSSLKHTDFLKKGQTIYVSSAAGYDL